MWQISKYKNEPLINYNINEKGGMEYEYIHTYMCVCAKYIHLKSYPRTLRTIL